MLCACIRKFCSHKGIRRDRSDGTETKSSRAMQSTKGLMFLCTTSCQGFRTGVAGVPQSLEDFGSAGEHVVDQSAHRRRCTDSARCGEAS
jgi:hypothetical protein